MNSTLVSAVKANRLSVGPRPDTSDDLNELVSRAKTDLVVLIFVAIWLVKLLVKTYLRFRKAMKQNRLPETQPLTTFIQKENFKEIL